MQQFSSHFEYPLRLSGFVRSFMVAKDMAVVRMDEESRERLLKIRDIKFDDNGLLIGFTPLPGCVFGGTHTSDFNENFTFISSNYILLAPDPTRAQDFNLCLKLLQDSASAIHIGYKLDGTTAITTIPSYFGKRASRIDIQEISKIRKLIPIIERKRVEPKVALMTQIFLYALSTRLRDESRFLELSVILEMLLLPKQEAELAYRFSLRMAKLSNTLFSEDTRVALQAARRIYNTRSKIVHTGSSKELDEALPQAILYARRLFLAYLETPDLFTNESLDDLCVGA